MNELAERVAEVGRRSAWTSRIKAIANPRKEREQHYYHPAHTGLIELGLEPHPMSHGGAGRDARDGAAHADRIDRSRIPPRVRWNAEAPAAMRRWLITGGQVSSAATWFGICWPKADIRSGP